LKLYFTLENDKDFVLSCALCNEKKRSDHHCGLGFGVTVSDEEVTFKCQEIEGSPRSLNKIEMKTCDLYAAGSASDTLQLQICKEKGDNSLRYSDLLAGKTKCCTTNMFGNGIERNKWMSVDGDTAVDDGGSQLGQCEGFPIDGTSVNIFLRNFYHGAICLDTFEFYGGKEPGLTYASHLPFLKCNPTCKIWGDGDESKCEGSGYTNWNETSAKCSYTSSLSRISGMTVNTCRETELRTSSAIQVIVENMDMDKCQTDVFSPPNPPGLPFRHVGSCKNHPINENGAQVWIMNQDPENSVCLTEVLLHVITEASDSKRLDCRMNKDVNLKMDSSKHPGLPLLCK